MSTFTEVSTILTAKISEVSHLLSELEITEPTFDESGFEVFDEQKLKASKNEALREARNALINASQDLIRLTAGPLDHIHSLAWSSAHSANIGTIVRLKVPEMVPRDGARSITDISKDIPGISRGVVESILKYSITNGVFCEPKEGFIAHTAASARLADDANLRDYCMTCTGTISALFSKFPIAMNVQRSSPDKPVVASDLAFPGYSNIFEYFGNNPDAAKEYFTFLAARSKISRFSVNSLVDAWDWNSLGDSPLIDVGSSAGSTAIVLCEAYPGLKVVCQDKDNVALEGGNELIRKLGLEERIQFMEHDFFSTQPIKAKGYLLKNILHDWPEDDCIKILRALLPALEVGAHVLVGEGIMPAGSATRAVAVDHQAIRIEDQLMIAAHGAGERTLVQFQAIFSQVSAQLQFNGAKRGYSGAFFSLMDFVLVA